MWTDLTLRLDIANFLEVFSLKSTICFCKNKQNRISYLRFNVVATARLGLPMSRGYYFNKTLTQKT